MPTSYALKAKSAAAGINWYLNESSKLALNYDHTTFDGGSSTGTKKLDGKAEDVLIARYQLAF